MLAESSRWRPCHPITRSPAPVPAAADEDEVAALEVGGVTPDD